MCIHMYTYIHVEIYSITCLLPIYTHLYCSKTVCVPLLRAHGAILQRIFWDVPQEKLNQVTLQYYYNNF